MSKLLENIVDGISPERKRRFEYADQIAEYLYYLLDKKDLNQKQLAKNMDMKASQLSRYMNAEANLNLETIARLEIALDENIISIKQVPQQASGRSITTNIENEEREENPPSNIIYFNPSKGNGSKKVSHKEFDKNFDPKDEVLEQTA